MKKGIVILLAIVLLGAIGAYLYVFNKPHRDPSSEVASHSLRATELAQEFSENPEEANRKYIDKVVEVGGVAMEVTDTYIILDNVLNCSLVEGHDVMGVQAGDEIVIKGRVIAFDDLLEEVKLDNCVKL